MGHIWETVYGNNWAIWKWVVICNSILLKLVIENFLVVVFLLLWVSVHSLVDHLAWDVIPAQWEDGQRDILGAFLHAAMLLISFTESCNRQSMILLIVHVQKAIKPAQIIKFCIFFTQELLVDVWIGRIVKEKLQFFISFRPTKRPLSALIE